MQNYFLHAKEWSIKIQIIQPSSLKQFESADKEEIPCNQTNAPGSAPQLKFTLHTWCTCCTLHNTLCTKVKFSSTFFCFPYVVYCFSTRRWCTYALLQLEELSPLIWCVFCFLLRVRDRSAIEIYRWSDDFTGKRILESALLQKVKP